MAGQSAKAKADDAADLSPWEPGDPVPGWEDADCPTTPGSAYIETHLDSPIQVLLGISGDGTGASPVTDRGMNILIADCSSVPCDDSSTELPASAARANAAIIDSVGGGESRGQGTYGPDDSEDAPYSLSWSWGVLEAASYYFAHGPYDDSSSVVCMSRIRPDEFRGTIIVRSRIDSHWRPPFYAKTDFELRVAFDIRLVDHAGRDYFGGEGSYIEPEGADHANVMYGFIDYDHAWPWDEITDPDIRAELYARYTPWNLP